MKSRSIVGLLLVELQRHRSHASFTSLSFFAAYWDEVAHIADVNKRDDAVRNVANRASPFRSRPVRRPAVTWPSSR